MRRWRRWDCLTRIPFNQTCPQPSRLGSVKSPVPLLDLIYFPSLSRISRALSAVALRLSRFEPTNDELPLRLQIATSLSFIPRHLILNRPTLVCLVVLPPVQVPVRCPFPALRPSPDLPIVTALRVTKPIHTRFDIFCNAAKKKPITANIIPGQLPFIPNSHSGPSILKMGINTHKEIVRYAPRNHGFASPWGWIKLQAKFALQSDLCRIWPSALRPLTSCTKASHQFP